jgi:hypothetical protein
MTLAVDMFEQFCSAFKRLAAEVALCVRNDELYVKMHAK